MYIHILFNQVPTSETCFVMSIYHGKSCEKHSFQLTCNLPACFKNIIHVSEEFQLQLYYASPVFTVWTDSIML